MEGNKHKRFERSLLVACNDLFPFLSLSTGILKFLRSSTDRVALVANLFLNRLLLLLEWFKEQREWTFVASSLLLAYEGSPERWEAAEQGQIPVEQLVVVKLIDFTHTYPSEKPARDENFLFGLKQLISCFERAKAGSD